MPVVFSPKALDDLAAIRTFIGFDNPFAASRMAVRLVAVCDQLEQMPERGRPGRYPGTRELTSVKPYVIVYRRKVDRVEIVRIWHGAQQREE
ncbi:type II toxin-antitoxin system RelE/ParE family toxin [Asticcacaulis excentricus]|uniref:type II toxin-antitoxin system RelE/ParE family toxin n=1 Tax=Asticcacaulis excentricus TaxID=78587 RepID=UPI000F81B212|nr:type II toxin-antitoxin system RelE/ParE family toxin [Asticcacaulis excentricus]